MDPDLRFSLAETAARHRTAEHQLVAAIREARAQGVPATHIAETIGWDVRRVRRVAAGC